MKDRKVGVYALQPVNVEVRLREGYGAAFANRPTNDSTPVIWIGADETNWSRVVGSLLHEALEFEATIANQRWVPSVDVARDLAGFLFVMDHTQFGEIVARSGVFMAIVLPDLASAWNRWQKKAKKRAKKGADDE